MDVIYRLPKLDHSKGKDATLTEEKALSMIRPQTRARADKRMFIDVVNDIRRMISEGDLEAARMKMREKRLSYKEVHESAYEGLADLVENRNLGKAKLVPSSFHLSDNQVRRAVSKGATRIVIQAVGELQNDHKKDHDERLGDARNLIAAVAEAARMFGFNERHTVECISSGLTRCLEGSKKDKGERAASTEACIDVIMIVKDSNDFGLSDDGIKEMPFKIGANLMKSGLPEEAAKVAARFLTEEDLQNLIKRISPNMQVYRHSRRKLKRGAKSEPPADLRK